MVGLSRLSRSSGEIHEGMLELFCVFFSGTVVVLEGAALFPGMLVDRYFVHTVILL